MNYDATLVHKESRMGIGVVITDYQGEVLALLFIYKHYLSDPLVVELQALWQAMKLCAELRIFNLLFGGDALSVVKAINNVDSS